MCGSVAVHDQEGRGRVYGAWQRRGVEKCGNGGVHDQAEKERDNEAAQKGEGWGVGVTGTYTTRREENAAEGPHRTRNDEVKKRGLRGDERERPRRERGGERGRAKRKGGGLSVNGTAHYQGR